MSPTRSGLPAHLEHHFTHPVSPELRLEESRALYLKYESATPIRTFSPTTDLVRDGVSFYLRDHALREVNCVLEFTEEKWLDIPFLATRRIWRSRWVRTTEAAREEIFWKDAFAIHGRIATGDLDTCMGMGFWRNISAESLHRGLHLYYFDLQLRDTPKEVLSHSEWEDIHSAIWSRGLRNIGRFVLISQNHFQNQEEPS